MTSGSRRIIDFSFVDSIELVSETPTTTPIILRAQKVPPHTVQSEYLDSQSCSQIPDRVGHRGRLLEYEVRES